MEVGDGIRGRLINTKVVSEDLRTLATGKRM